MAQNYKHIFIGLGGAGVNTVAFIKKRSMTRPRLRDRVPG